MPKKRLVACTAAVLTIFLILVPSALAAEIPFNVYIDGRIKSSGEAVITQKNTVSVRVYDAAGGEHTVKVGSMAAANYGPGDYRVNYYPLKTGLNKITVVADTYKNTYEITYLDKALPGAGYYISSIPASGTITAIDKTLTLKFPKNNYIVSGLDNPQIVDDQGLRIEVVEFYNSYSPTSYHHIVSPVYKITPASSELKSDSERKDAAVLYPGELVLKYDDSVSSASADTLTVIWIPYSDSYYDSDSEDFSYYWRDNWVSRRCVVLGGSVDTSARTITVPFSRNGFGTYAVFNVVREFTDLLDASQNLAWARNYVLPIWAKGVMEVKGSGEGFTNVSDENITREEFTVAIVKAMGISVKENLRESFIDLPSDLEIPEHYDYILTAARNGIVYGFPTENGMKFKPQEYLTREQAATIIARVAGLKVSDNEAATAASMAKAFYDYSKNPGIFGPWASPFIYAAYKAGFVQGSPVTVEKKTLYEFRPKDNLTRAEAAKLIYVLMKKQKRI